MNHLKAVKKSLNLLRIFGDDVRTRDKLVDSLEHHLSMFSQGLANELGLLEPAPPPARVAKTRSSRK